MAFVKNHTDGNMTCTKIKYETDAILGLDDSDCDVSLFYKNVAFIVTNLSFNLVSQYLSSVVLSVILILLLYVLYKSYWSPILYVKELSEIGFEHIAPGPDREKRITRAQATRKQGSKVPPPYPNGWFALAESRELKVGGVMSVDALGKNFCVYRGEDGTPHVVDAYCPHLGANLAIGGSVSGGCIECPFHKWKFDETGSCVEVPGAECAPKGVSIKTWTCVEADGAVWVWHDAENRPPLWELTDAPECKEWAYRGRNEFIVCAHIQEIPENGADVAHLNAVHSPSVFTALGEKYPFLYDIVGRHVWAASWTRNEDHTAHMSLTHDYRVFGVDLLHTSLSITQSGPGHVRLRMQTSVGNFLFSQSVTPIGPLLQRVVHRLYCPPYNAWLAGLVIVGEAKMIERDVRIWNNKKFMAAPAYVKTDKTIRAFRTWYSQFYTDHSISFRDALQNPLDW